MKAVKIILLTILMTFVIITLGVRFFGINQYVVTTSSMHPNIPKYSLCYIKQLSSNEVADSIEIGDVVAMDVGAEIPLMHRVIEIDGDTITTQGDYNDQADAPIAMSQVIGVMVFSIPVIGFLFISIYPWIILMLLVIFYYGIKYVIKELKQSRR